MPKHCFGKKLKESVITGKRNRTTAYLVSGTVKVLYLSNLIKKNVCSLLNICAFEQQTEFVFIIPNVLFGVFR